MNTRTEFLFRLMIAIFILTPVVSYAAAYL
jgi:hypothetical protein